MEYSFDVDQQPTKKSIAGFDHFHLIAHPIVECRVTQARRYDVDISHIRRSLADLGIFLLYEALRDCAIKEIEIQTPLARTTGCELQNPIALFPLLRAGLSFIPSIYDVLPDAAILPIGMRRNEETLQPEMYMEPKLPQEIIESICLIADPMIATGGSVIKTIEFLQQAGCKDIRIICAIASGYGVTQILTRFPDIHIYAAALDDKLNEHGYIVPGMGDAGDRYCGT